MQKSTSVSLCMIVKNEEKFLESCLNSVKDIVDEMIILDTGSNDNTIKIAEKFNAKIYKTVWTNNFSIARNITLSKATKDWILIMDADDVFCEEDKEKFLKVLEYGRYDGYYFETLSYVNQSNKNDIVKNLNIRLIKNTGEYEFIGAIHEQIAHKFKETDHTKFHIEDIRIYHSGYLKTVVDEKKKRERNIPIIKEELKKNENNPFHNFNLGNEYFALGELKEAKKYYDIAYKNMQSESGYSYKLIVKRINCLIELKEYECALNEIKLALNIYPNNSELNFYNGYVYQKQRRYTLAIKEFKKSIQNNISDKSLEVQEFLNGCGGFRSYFALGDIYLNLKDYDEAIVNYNESIRLNYTNKIVYYKLATTYKQKYKENIKIIEALKNKFNLDDLEDLILFSLVLMRCNIYDYPLELLEKAKLIENSDRVLKEIGKCLLYSKRYEESIKIFNSIPKSSLFYDEILVNKVVGKLLSNESVNLEEITQIKNDCTKKALISIYFVNKTGETPYITENADKVLKECINILEIILKTKEVMVFEKELSVLNYIESDKVLLELSKLYKNNNYYELALDEAIRSIKEFGVIDKESCEIIFFNFI